MIGIAWARLAPLVPLGLLLTAGGCGTVDASPVFANISGGATMSFGKGYRASPLGWEPAFTNYRVFSPSECLGGTIASVSSFHQTPTPRPVWSGRPIVLSADTGHISSDLIGFVASTPIFDLRMSAPCNSAVMFTPASGEAYMVRQDTTDHGCAMTVRDAAGQPVELRLAPSATPPCDRPPAARINGG